MQKLIPVAVLLLLAVTLHAQSADTLAGKKAVFLGDSITQSGGYVTDPPTTSTSSTQRKPLTSTAWASPAKPSRASAKKATPVAHSHAPVSSNVSGVCSTNSSRTSSSPATE